MELWLVGVFVGGTVFVVLMLYGIYAGIRRMQGHATRLDGLFETYARTQRAGVYPPSLRGDPEPQIQEAAQVSRADRAVRATPGNRESDKNDA